MPLYFVQAFLYLGIICKFNECCDKQRLTGFVSEIDVNLVLYM
ncbi:hypothetical protein VRK_25680 [Vibrio sp. MEBiC08052]|nr:hypothetical protein VRK_25680 [Vibrio sp. MEBiC08052]